MYRPIECMYSPQNMYRPNFPNGSFPSPFPHDVDIMYIQENELGIRVAVVALVAAALGLVGHSVHAGPCVHDGKFVRLRVGVHDHLDVLLIILVPLARHAHQRLAGPANGRLALGMNPR